MLFVRYYWEYGNLCNAPCLMTMFDDIVSDEYDIVYEHQSASLLVRLITKSMIMDEW